MQDLPKVTDQLEFLFLKRIATGLRDGSIDLPTAKKSATTFRQIEPFNSVDDAKQKMQSFSSQYNNFTVLKEYIDAYYNEQYKDTVVEKMRSHLQQGNIDQALEVAKQ